jgi:predicted nucleic acid-binding protein
VELAVDASTLVAEALRERGRALLTDRRLALRVALEAWGEFEHELSRRVQVLVRRGVATERQAEFVLDEGLNHLRSTLTIVPPEAYAPALAEATRRVPRDPNDAPTVALALTLGCGILTGDYDFFGCGVPVWTVETLLLHLQAGGR